LCTDRECMRVPRRVGFLPLRAPHRRSRRHSARADGAAVKHAGANAAPSEETQTRVVKVVVIELIDHGAGATSRQERVNPTILEENIDARIGLVAEVLAHHPCLSFWIVGFADTV